MRRGGPPRRVAPQAPPDVVLVDGRAADRVSVLERALHYGDGLFETIACVDGRPRLGELHLERLRRGCERLALDADLAALAREVSLLAAGRARAIVKVILSRGPARSRGYGPSGVERATRIALRYRWTAETPRRAQAGVRVRIARVRLGENPALAGLKHCNRLEQVLARAEWRDPGIAEALMFSSSGALISGTMSNVFLVEGGRVLTPRLDRCGVAGVMRAAVLATAAEEGLVAEERRLGPRDLERAEELFLTNALTGIRPVRQLEGRTFAVGALTRRLQRRLARRLSRSGPARSGPPGSARGGRA